MQCSSLDGAVSFNFILNYLFVQIYYCVQYNPANKKKHKIYFYVDDKNKTARVRLCVCEWVSVRTLVVYVCLCVAPAVSDHWEMAGDATAGSLDATPIEFFKIWWRSYCNEPDEYVTRYNPLKKLKSLNKKCQ